MSALTKMDKAVLWATLIAIVVTTASALIFL